MKYFFKKIPRIFKVGLLNDILISDFGEIDLGEDEQITFLHVNNSRFDFAKWSVFSEIFKPTVPREHANT